MFSTIALLFASVGAVLGLAGVLVVWQGICAEAISGDRFRARLLNRHGWALLGIGLCLEAAPFILREII